MNTLPGSMGSHPNRNRLYFMSIPHTSFRCEKPKDVSTIVWTPPSDDLFSYSLRFTNHDARASLCYFGIDTSSFYLGRTDDFYKDDYEVYNNATPCLYGTYEEKVTNEISIAMERFKELLSSTEYYLVEMRDFHNRFQGIAICDVVGEKYVNHHSGSFNKLPKRKKINLDAIKSELLASLKEGVHMPPSYDRIHRILKARQKIIGSIF